MFGCKARNPEKIEGMASWLILGGYLPLAVALVITRRAGLSFDSLLTFDQFLYLWVIAMGIISLVVRRASARWHIIVVCGIGGLCSAAALRVEHGDMVLAIAWPLAVLVLVFVQYRHDIDFHLKKLRQSDQRSPGPEAPSRSGARY